MRIAEEARKKAVAGLEYDFKRELAKLLPKGTRAIEVILDRKGQKSDSTKLRAVELTANRIFGMPAQEIRGSGGGPLVVSFQQVLAGVDGSKKENLG